MYLENWHNFQKQSIKIISFIIIIHSLLDLSSLTREPVQLAMETQSPNYWTPRESLFHNLN